MDVFEANLWRHQWCLIWDDIFINEVKLKLCLIFQYCQNELHFKVATNFLPEGIPEVEYASKIVLSM